MSGSSEVISEPALEDDSSPGTGPFDVVLRVAGAPDRNSVGPIVLVEKVLDREIEREIPGRLVLQIQIDEVVPRRRRVGRRNVPVRDRRRPHRRSR